ncbi:hypothetical protein PsAD2_02532 [Pseudovibrio axinellae]|uniref:Uncharacterized protein n=1 Tax=Pseudovibrio axinellae TaxID=989403 RepID=A0A165YNF5_9HYPH|nr:hypothetical protein [Pseudovibrio axinellae]KZL19013.1 hypothetical protein PsAD2_02532 [Pseudovibrio axinellae]SEP83883.1 hypothetical protein SAMN05421798_101509 [Pseudovibrio axinellae]
MTHKREIFIVCSIIVVAIVLINNMSESAAETQRLDSKHIKNISVVGDSVAFDVRTAKRQRDNETVALKTNDKRGCALSADIERDGDTVTVTFKKHDKRFWGVWWGCTPTASLQLPPDLSLTIELSDMAADIRGAFKAISVTSDHALLSFTGETEKFYLFGDAALINLQFLAPILNKDITLNVDKLVSRIKYAQ